MPWEHDDLTGRIIGAAIAVHRDLGPGLLEGTYEECLAAELDFCGIRFEKQVSLPISYREKILTRAYRLDFVVEKSVVIELKAVEKILPVHEAQMLTYLRLSGLETGLVINFNSVPLKAGIRRINKTKTSPVSPVSR
jgi:GxxExxY protein